MTSFTALLRGINVGGKCLVAMGDLRKLLEGAGFTEVQSLLQSGNLVFKSASSDGDAMEIKLEKELAKKLGRTVDFFVRSAKEWKEIIKGNPFREEAGRDPGHLLVMCLKDSPDAAALEALKASITGPEYFQAKGRQLYIVYPDGIGRSRVTNALIEKKLATRGTARNWNTAQKIAALLEGDS